MYLLEYLTPIILGTANTANEFDRMTTQLRPESQTGSCWWIGMQRVGGVYLWDDGTTVDYDMWAPGEGKQNQCVCVSVDDNYKWVTQDCKTSNPYVCQREESGSVWIAANQTPNEWLMVDLGSIVKISGIITQGHPEEDSWVSIYELSFSDKV
jgi:hypothetical protein